MLRRLLVLLFFVCFILQTKCSFADVPRAGVLFLQIDPDARAGGMGGASVALADDAVATYYNPAGITGVKLVSGEVDYAHWLPELASDLHHTYVCGAVNLGEYGHVGIAFKHLSPGESVRTDEHGNVKGVFDSYEMAIGVSYAYQLTDNFSSGLNAKYIYSRLAEQGAGLEKGKGTGQSMALDVGLLWENILPELTITETLVSPDLSKLLGNRKSRGLSVGLVVSNIGPDISYVDLNQADPLPRELRIGGAYRAVDTDLVGISVAMDYCKGLVGVTKNFFKEYFDPKHGVILKIGGEITFLYLLTLRSGYLYDEEGDVKTWTYGVGIGPEWGRFNISHIPEQHDLALSSTTRLSLSFDYPLSVF
ncbi:MAG: PorV/PorQ family protein [candidate division Zixibacteria bacterium]|nr:PorV/PorQ family protein [candidate division Zixibacteria bacterium]